jgi:ABC-type molybdate transport system permease subunit
MNVDFMLRAAAVLAAVAVVAGPSVVAAVRAALRWRPAQTEEASPDDAHTVLEIARRLQRAGSTEGVKLCQQLIDVLLKPEKK